MRVIREPVKPHLNHRWEHWDEEREGREHWAVIRKSLDWSTKRLTVLFSSLFLAAFVPVKRLQGETAA